MTETDQLKKDLERAQTKLLFAEAEIQGLKETIRKMRRTFLNPAGVPHVSCKVSEIKPPNYLPARVRKVPLPHSSGILLMLSNFEWKCFYCASELDAYTVTVDHLLPKSKGGCGLHNQVPSCLACNSKKGDRLPTPEEVERAEKVHLRTLKAARRAINPALYPLENIQLGPNGRVICRTNASGSS